MSYSSVSTGSGGLPDPNEDFFESTTVERLHELGYIPKRGADLRGDDFPTGDVVHRPTLRRFLRRTYPELDEQARAQAVQRIASPDGVDLAQKNKEAHRLITKGFEQAVEREDGSTDYVHVYPIDWDDPEANDFWVVQQLPIAGDHDRRPDLVVYVNGLPLVVFELKNPYREDVDVENAFNQLQHYTQDLPRLFQFNAFCVVSDGTETLHGVHSASREWFKPWMSVDGETVIDDRAHSMRTLVEGLFPKKRLLAYVRHFIVHETTGSGITKKGALYHQFFGVRRAVQETERATGPDGDQKIGVIWHTQGAGKSLSMVFLVGILRQRLGNPTILIEVDRNDLDEQLYDAFVAARPLVGSVHQAESVDDLRARLQTQGGEVIFTTIEKFQLKDAETEHPQLTDRDDVIVIADEAHRTQYGFEGRIRRDPETGEVYVAYGYARYLRQALPNASFIGFTGTPIDEDDRSTTAVFGDMIHTYDMRQAEKDGAVLEILYEPRLINLQLVNENIDKEAKEIGEGDDVEVEKQKWSAVERAAGTDERQEKLAADVVEHFRKRQQAHEAFDGVGMIVCMSRRNCVGLYDAITDLRPEWHDSADDKGRIKIVMTGNISEDPPEWNERGHITTKQQREHIKERFKDPDDPLHLVIVCDMWLTGTNIPPLHTLYVDKPMKGHTLMQAIARVNRVFRDKPGGLVVDYIGIGTELKRATKRYTDRGFGAPAEELEEVAFGEFEKALEEIRASLPEDVDRDTVSGWRTLSNTEFEDLVGGLYNHYLATDEQRDDFLRREQKLRKAYSLIQHRDEADAHADEVAIYQYVRTQLNRTKSSANREESEEHAEAIRDLVERSIAAEDAVDVYAAAGIEKPDISILDERFLEEFKSDEGRQNLRLKLLEKLMRDEIRVRKRENLQKYRSLQEILEETLKKYRENTITAAEVMKALVEMRKEYFSEDERKEAYNLTNEEIAFIDAINEVKEDAYDMPFLCDLVRDVVDTVKSNLEVDWTKPHRENVKASVRSAVKRVLRRKGVTGDDLQAVQEEIMAQAESLYRDWPRQG